MPSALNSCLIILYLFSHKVIAQGTFHGGAKLGLGGSPVTLNASLASSGNATKALTGTTLSTGIITQYIIGRRLGIESGFHMTHYSYYHDDGTNLLRRRLWKGAAAVELFDFQFPIVILYRFPLPSDPFRDITLGAGTTIDWLGTDFLAATSKAMWLKNIYANIRMGKERMKGNRLEYGLEFQYTMDRFTLQGMNYNQENMRISSRLSLLSINVYYFFFKQRVGKLES